MEGDGGGPPFGTLLRQLRLASGLSQEALAERAQLSVDGISALERGTRRAPQWRTLAALSAGLGLCESDRLRLEAAAAPARQQLLRGGENAGGAYANRHNLPFPATSFLGRERDGMLLTQRLAEQRLVTLAGAGGVGKTRLAVEIVRTRIGHFADGIWLVELAPLSDPALVAARVAATLGVPQRLAKNSAWIAEITHRQMLIVLDNCEHLLDATSVVAQQLLEQCPHVNILATSREPLRIPGESVYRLSSLELPAYNRSGVPDVEDLRRSPAIRMFLDRARNAIPDFAIGDDDYAAWHALQTVCRRLDGMPLAIELAAARLIELSLDMLVQVLDGLRFDSLAGPQTDLPRHQTLRALLDWSYKLLNDSERRVLRRLAVFGGGWTLEAAETVCADAPIAAADLISILVSLVDKSLVVADTSVSASRYGMLETTRAYALELLFECGEYDLVAHTHAEYYLQLVQTANRTWAQPTPSEWLSRLEPELDNLRAALQWSIVDGHTAALAGGIAESRHAILELLSLFGAEMPRPERPLLFVSRKSRTCVPRAARGRSPSDGSARF